MSKSNTVLRLEEMSWKQIDELDRKKTIFFQPISLLEEHGPHLPIGMDYITSRDLAIETIKTLNKKHPELKCILLPPIPLGTCRANSDFPGTITTGAKVIKEVIFGVSSSLARHGFKYIIICTWHLDFYHLKGIHQGMNKAIKKYKMRIYEPTGPYFWNGKVEEFDEKLKKKGYKIDFDPEKQMHACHRETSIMKYQYPYLVNDVHKRLPTVYVNLASRKCHGKHFKQLGLIQGYSGSPANANEEYGKLHFQDIVNLYADSALGLLEGKKMLDMPDKIKTAFKLPFI